MQCPSTSTHWHSFHQPRKDDRLSQPPGVLIQRPTGLELRTLGSQAATLTTKQTPGSAVPLIVSLYLYIHPSIGTILCAERWCCLISLLGYWTQSRTGRHSDTGYQLAGTHFADLGRMTGRVNPPWCYFNSQVGFELGTLGCQAQHQAFYQDTGTHFVDLRRMTG